MSHARASMGLAVLVALVMVASSVLVFGAAIGSVSTASAASSVRTESSLERSVTVTGPSSLPAAGTASSSPASASTSSLSLDAERVAAVDSARQAFVNSGISLDDFLPPNLNAAPGPTTETGGHIVPLYNYAAAPLGLSTLGLENTSGTTTPYILNTTSLEGTFSTGDPLGIQAVSPYYGTLQAYGDQLNTVLNNTTILGKGGYDYWLQNVITYTTSSNSLRFELNIWNFTSPTFYFPSNGILHGNGRVEDSEVYETSGPSITIAYPFTLDLYLNTTVGSYDGSPMVNEAYFNYTVINSAGQVVCPTTEPTGEVCGMYDNVYFNSGVNVHAGSAQIQANGFQYTPVGLPSDMEMDVGIGQSDGANANVVYANATVGLYVLNATTHKYQTPPSTYDFGSETGETDQGEVATWATSSSGAPVATLHQGPSLLQGLWNVTGGTTGAPSIGAGAEGAYALNYAGVTPGNAFIAIAPGAGTTNGSLFQLAPTFGWYSGGGTIGKNLWLSPGEYTVEVMLSGWNEETVNVDLTSSGQTLVLALTAQTTPTVYTPLWAYSNSDLQNLSVSGSGSSSSPYVLVSDQTGSLNSVFGILNDYLFIVYSGIWINGTGITDHFELNSPPSLLITTPTWWYFQIETLADSYGPMPYYNQLPMYFYDASGFIVQGGTNIGLWSSDIEVGHDYSVYCNGCTDALFADNRFNVSSEGLDISGTSATAGNYVWGNTFVPYSNPAWTAVSAPSTGLVLSSGGNHVYNNAFYTNRTLTSTSTTLENWFNVTGGYQPSSYSVVVNGVTLTGSIVGTSLQGGNYYRDYGAYPNPYGVLPYVGRASSPTGSVGIGKGGDYAPLAVSSTGALLRPNSGLYEASFTETGLPASTSWTLRIVGVPIYEPLYSASYSTNPTNTSTTATLTFWLPNGTYQYTVSTTNHLYYALGSHITVAGAALTPSVTFSLYTYSVTVTETGLPSGTTWFATVNSVTSSSSTSQIAFAESNGSWAYSVAGAIGFTASPASGTVTVSGAAANVPVTETAWTTGGGAIVTLYTVYNARPDLQTDFPDASSNMASFEGLVNWAGSVVRGGTSDAANQTLFPYGYWYDVMSVYDQRGDLQYAFPNAFTVQANYSALLTWSGQVVTHVYTDSAATLLAEFGYYYDLAYVYNSRADLQAAFPNALTTPSEWNTLLIWAGEVATNAFTDSSASTLASYNYYYVLAFVYNSRGDLQSAFPNALTNGASWASLIAWAQNVVNHKFPDSSYATLLPYAAEYNAL